MNIFDKRPLCLILCTMLGSFAFFAFFSGNTVMQISLAALPVIAIIYSFTVPRLTVFGFGHGFIRCLSALSILCMLLSYLYFDIWFQPHLRFSGDEVTIDAVITDMPDEEYGATTVKTKSINGEAFSSYKLKAYIDSDKFYNYSVGSRVEIVGIIKEFDDPDIETYYRSVGIPAEIDDISSLKLTEVGNFTLEYRISAFRRSDAPSLTRAAAAAAD